MLWRKPKMKETNMVAELEISKEMRNLKVLLAEDNEVNQLLAKGILRHWGVETKLAENGFEVLGLLQQEDFDVVLMDIQMPEKSGTEAAREIRQLLDPRKKNIPIIALTANGLKGEEKKYIAAGMDDFLTKPFKESELQEVIERVMRKEGTFERKTLTSVTGIQPEIKQTVQEKLYDFDQLADLTEGNPDFAESLALMFVETIPPTGVELLEAAKARDWIKVSKLAHKLKSTIDSMNIVAIKSDIRSLEVDAKNKVNPDLLYKLTVKVNYTIDEVVKQLKRDFNL